MCQKRSGTRRSDTQMWNVLWRVMNSRLQCTWCCHLTMSGVWIDRSSQALNWLSQSSWTRGVVVLNDWSLQQGKVRREARQSESETLPFGDSRWNGETLAGTFLPCLFSGGLYHPFFFNGSDWGPWQISFRPLWFKLCRLNRVTQWKARETWAYFSSDVR